MLYWSSEAQLPPAAQPVVVVRVAFLVALANAGRRPRFVADLAARVRKNSKDRAFQPYRRSRRADKLLLLSNGRLPLRSVKRESSRLLSRPNDLNTQLRIP